MKYIHLSTYSFISFLSFYTINSTEFKTYSNCTEGAKSLFESDSYSITWNINNDGQTNACALPLNFLNYRVIELGYTFHGCPDCFCHSVLDGDRGDEWDCQHGQSAYCPSLVYITSGPRVQLNHYTSVTMISNYLKLQYCGAYNDVTAVSIYVYPTSYWNSTISLWQFIYIGIPIISISTIILIILIYIIRRRRRINRMEQSLINPRDARTTTTNIYSNQGYQSTQTTNQINLPPTYNPSGYN